MARHAPVSESEAGLEKIWNSLVQLQMVVGAINYKIESLLKAVADDGDAV